MSAMITAVPASPCPAHPDVLLIPCPGGAARGTCPRDGRTHQMSALEVTW